MQALVIAHAAYGHNSFFKGNYLFQTWTNADAIVDYLIFARNFISQCEQRHGEEEVELLLDSCHALMNLGVDRYRRPQKLSLGKEQMRQREREEYMQSQVNELWRTLPQMDSHPEQATEVTFPPEPEENLLYFIEKHAPLLEPWEREVVRIVRKIAQYFFPQRQTQVMNEGWATFWHYTILNHLYDEGLLADSFMLEFLQSHTNVVYQPAYNERWYNGINPYALGFAMWQDIKRICENPTDEDREWFPDIAGSDWRATFDFAMRSFKDESFVAQFLSPKLIRDFRFFSVLDDEREDKLKVSAIHDDPGYRKIRETLSEQYNLGSREPNIQVWNVDLRGDRSITLRHQPYQQRPLGNSTEEVMKHFARLWGFTVRLESVDEHGSIEVLQEARIEKRRGRADD
jgi:spore cortex formation protein SpoVR/YcgB (stage V sporulation)